MEKEKLDDTLDRIVGRNNPIRFNIESWAKVNHPDIPETIVVTDNLHNPSLVMLMGIDWATGWSNDDSKWTNAFMNLAMGEGEFPAGFPGFGVWKGGSVSSPEIISRPYIFLNQAVPGMARGALAAGYEHQGESNDFEPAAQLWYIDGAPRFGEYVKHTCMTFEGMELFEAIRTGWPHGDADSTYIQWCLKSGPSFACVVDGEIVCASSTHLSKTMGMIYTPEEHRGKGYASSLTAYQTDEMLRRYGYATAHIWHSNIASQALVKKLGFELHTSYFGWWRFFFPETRS